FDVGEERVDALSQLGRRRELGADGGDALHVLGTEPHHRDVELPLARKVVVEQTFRDAGGRGDFVDRDRVVGASIEQPPAELEQLRAALIDGKAGARTRSHQADASRVLTIVQWCGLRSKVGPTAPSRELVAIDMTRSASLWSPRPRGDGCAPYRGSPKSC